MAINPKEFGSRSSESDSITFAIAEHALIDLVHAMRLSDASLFLGSNFGDAHRGPKLHWEKYKPRKWYGLARGLLAMLKWKINHFPTMVPKK